MQQRARRGEHGPAFEFRRGKDQHVKPKNIILNLEYDGSAVACSSKYSDGDDSIADPNWQQNPKVHSKGRSDPNNDSSSDSGVDDAKVIQKRKCQVPFPCDLPSTEGTNLDLYTSKFDIIKHLDEFTRMWSSDLSKRTKANPLPSDFSNYAKSIVKQYPFLGTSIVKKTKTGEDAPSHRAMADKLSACKRRRRNYIKSLANKISKKNQIPKRSPLKKIIQVARQTVKPGVKQNLLGTLSVEKQTGGLHNKATKKSSSDEELLPATNDDFEDQDELLRELKKTVNLKDTAHVKLLLEKTLRLRRTWINDSSKNCAEVLDEYPTFKNIEFILYEAELQKWYPKAKVDENFSVMVSQLADHFKVPPEDHLTIVGKLETELYQSKPLPSMARAVFGDTSCLKPDSNDSLRLVLFVDVRTIKTAFVVGEGLRWDITDASLSKGLCCLLAAYYTMNREFPKMYRNLFHFLEVKLFGLPASGSPGSKLRKLLQIFD